MAAAPLALWTVGPTLGVWKTPGARDAALFEALLSAGHLSSDAPLAGLVLGGLSAVVDPVMALGLLTLIGYLTVGIGGWMLGWKTAARQGLSPEASAGVALLGLMAGQLSPALLRAMCTAEVGALGLGLAALAVALPGVAGVVLAGLAAAWCAPMGLMALAGRWRSGWTWAVVVPALAAQVLLGSGAPSEDSGIAQEVGAYVTEEKGVIPLPVEAEPEATPPGVRQRLRGLWGGLAAVVGVLAALLVGPRALGAVGAVILVALTLGVGWMPPPEAAGSPVAPWWASAHLGSGVLWGAALALPASAGLCALAARFSPALWAGLALAFFSAMVENPRLALPVTNLPPDPGLSTLASVDPGKVVVFPSPAPPWRQPPRSEAELAWVTRQHGQPAAEPEPIAGLVGEMCAIAGVPLDLRAGPLVWSAEPWSPEALKQAGVAYLLLDRTSLPPDGKGPLEGWLAGVMGPPLAEGEDYSLYTVDKEATPEDMGMMD